MIVVGDSEYEMDAGKFFKMNMRHEKKSLIKLIKLKEEPTCKELTRQLYIVMQRFKQIAGGH